MKTLAPLLLVASVLVGCGGPTEPTGAWTIRVHPGAVTDIVRVPLPGAATATRIVGMRLHGWASTGDGFMGAEILTQDSMGRLHLPIADNGIPHAFSANGVGRGKWVTIDAPQQPMTLQGGARVLSVWVRHGSRPSEVEWIQVVLE